MLHCLFLEVLFVDVISSFPAVYYCFNFSISWDSPPKDTLLIDLSNLLSQTQSFLEFETFCPCQIA